MAASIQAGVFDCCVFVFIHYFSPLLHSFFTDMMEAFWNMNQDDDKEYNEDKEEEDLFEVREEQQSNSADCIPFPSIPTHAVFT